MLAQRQGTVHREARQTSLKQSALSAICPASECFLASLSHVMGVRRHLYHGWLSEMSGPNTRIASAGCCHDTNFHDVTAHSHITAALHLVVKRLVSCGKCTSRIVAVMAVVSGVAMQLVAPCNVRHDVTECIRFWQFSLDYCQEIFHGFVKAAVEKEQGNP
jgi:hypothetical protein